MEILLEQFVYGSFPFWDRGYDVLARSPGCRADWLADGLLACRRYGEAPAGSEPSHALFALRLQSGPWAIVGVSPQGADDRGRPGALAFHALIVSARDYRRAGSNPFAFAGAIRPDWSEGATLESRRWAAEAAKVGGKPADPRVGAIARALGRRRRIALKSEGPAEGLVREVWAALPGSTRRRASMATWAFGNANRFDLVALPRLDGVELDRSYIDPASLDAPPARPALAVSARWAVPAALGMAGVVAGGAGWRALSGPGRAEPPVADRESQPSPPVPESPVGLEEGSRIVSGLAELAERFEAFDVGSSADPSAFLARLAGRVRYRGPTLSAAEVAGLSAESDPDRDRALAWHGRIKAFDPGRALPGDFDRASLPRQVAEVARSFGVEPSADPGATVDALAESLARDGPVRPTPLAARYPALSDYARFLGRLPRRGNGTGGR